MIISRWIIYLSIFLGAETLAKDSLECQSGFLVSSFYNNSMISLNSLEQPEFSIEREKFENIIVSDADKNDLVIIYPWNRAHYTKLPYAEKNKVMTKITINHGKWFELKIETETDLKYLSCTL